MQHLMQLSLLQRGISVLQNVNNHNGVEFTYRFLYDVEHFGVAVNHLSCDS